MDGVKEAQMQGRLATSGRKYLSKTSILIIIKWAIKFLKCTPFPGLDSVAHPLG